MTNLFLGHLVVYRCGVRVSAAQPVGERAIDAVVLVFVGDGERQYLLLVQFAEALHAQRLSPRKTYIRILLNYMTAFANVPAAVFRNLSREPLDRGAQGNAKAACG